MGSNVFKDARHSSYSDADMRQYYRKPPGAVLQAKVLDRHAKTGLKCAYISAEAVLLHDPYI